jgi:hypothetical protein
VLIWQPTVKLIHPGIFKPNREMKQTADKPESDWNGGTRPQERHVAPKRAKADGVALVNSTYRVSSRGADSLLLLCAKSKRYKYGSTGFGV